MYAYELPSTKMTLLAYFLIISTESKIGGTILASGIPATKVLLLRNKTGQNAEK